MTVTELQNVLREIPNPENTQVFLTEDDVWTGPDENGVLATVEFVTLDSLLSE